MDNKNMEMIKDLVKFLGEAEAIDILAAAASKKAEQDMKQSEDDRAKKEFIDKMIVEKKHIKGYNEEA